MICLHMVIRQTEGLRKHVCICRCHHICSAQSLWEHLWIQKHAVFAILTPHADFWALLGDKNKNMLLITKRQGIILLLFGTSVSSWNQREKITFASSITLFLPLARTFEIIFSIFVKFLTFFEKTRNPTHANRSISFKGSFPKNWQKNFPRAQSFLFGLCLCRFAPYSYAHERAAFYTSMRIRPVLLGMQCVICLPLGFHRLLMQRANGCLAHTVTTCSMNWQRVCLNIGTVNSLTFSRLP